MIDSFDVKAFDEGFDSYESAIDWAKDNLGMGWNVVCNKDTNPQDFNQKAGGKYIYIFYKVSASTNSPVVGLRMRHDTGSGENGWKSCSQNLNEGTKSSVELYLSYFNAEEMNGPVIGGLQSGYGETVESAMSDFGRSFIVLRQDINQDAGGKFIFLGYTYA